MPQLNDETRKALKTAHGDIHVLTTPRVKGHDFAFRKVGVVEFDAFMAMISSRDGNEKTQAHRQLAKDLLVFPDAAAFDELLKDLPGLAHTFGTKLAELGGLDADITVGKG